MGRGLGNLQKAILVTLKQHKHLSVKETYREMQCVYWGNWFDSLHNEDKPEHNRRAASIGQSLRALRRRGLIEYAEDRYCNEHYILTDLGKELLNDLNINDINAYRHPDYDEYI